MLKPPMPNLPGVGAMTDTLDFVKNLWGSMAVPGMGLPGIAAPAMSVEDLEKKIADLKAVEGWLNMNLSMLRGTIQTLEVQRGTLVTLKSMGEALSNAVKQPGANEKSVMAAAPYASAFFGQPAAPAPKPASEPAKPAAPEAKAEQPKDPAASAAAAAMANPAAWWNLLQNQFQQAVSSAMSPEAVAKAQDAATAPVREMQKAMSEAVEKNAEAKRPAAKRAAKPKDEGK
ncbi:MAG: PhaM family polyhydroxyalkanoate granule multifunctional regulatory protein [Gammaproteobacteria bacterium]